LQISTKSQSTVSEQQLFTKWNLKTEVSNKVNTDYSSTAGDFFTFQQDNAPAHQAGDTVEFLSRMQYTRFHLTIAVATPNSPDLNPVDYEVWGVLQQRVYHSGIPTSTT